MSNKIKVSVIGASGYTGKELVSILAGHEKIEINALLSRSYAGKNISELHPPLKGKISMVLSGASIRDVPSSTEVVFLALPHTKSMKYVPELLKRDMLVIDLSADYRFKNINSYNSWYGVKHSDTKNIKEAVFGLPEVNREKIKEASLIANPGCYATAVILSLYPLLMEGILKSSVFIDAKSGISGAGKKLDDMYLFTNRYENLTPYNVNSHRHMGEIIDFLSTAAGEKWDSLVFCPHLIPVERGILANLYAKVKKGFDGSKIREIYLKYYGDEHFISICEEGNFPNLKEVNLTNNCSIGIKYCRDTRSLIVISAIDNLVKGASGQAVQNMNIALGFKETLGLI